MDIGAGRKRDNRLRRLLRRRIRLARQQGAPKATQSSTKSPSPETSVYPIAPPFPPESSVQCIAAPPLSLNEEESRSTLSEREESRHPRVEKLLEDDTSPSKRKRIVSASDQTKREKIPRRRVHFQDQRGVIEPSASSRDFRDKLAEARSPQRTFKFIGRSLAIRLPKRRERTEMASITSNDNSQPPGIRFLGHVSRDDRNKTSFPSQYSDQPSETSIPGNIDVLTYKKTPATKDENTNSSSESTELKDTQTLSIENSENEEGVDEKPMTIANSAALKAKSSYILPIRSTSIDTGLKDIASMSIAQRAAGSTESVKEISQGSLLGSMQVPDSAEGTSAAHGAQPSPPPPTQVSREARRLRNLRSFEALQEIRNAMAGNTGPDEMWQKRQPDLRLMGDVDEMGSAELLARDREYEAKQQVFLNAVKHESLLRKFHARTESSSTVDSSESNSSSRSEKMQPTGSSDDKDFEAMKNELDAALGGYLDEESGNQLGNQPQDKPKSQPDEGMLED
ncbi:MAG: hypothetical protein Q9167_005340 [Letrouitia subvulpina]